MTSEENDLHLSILRTSPISMYYRNSVLRADQEWFRDNNFEVIDTNCVGWHGENVHEKLKALFNFPDYYGENLNALADCLGDLKNDDKRGLVITLRRYDSFVVSDIQVAEAVLDVIAGESWQWLLEGKYLLCLVQSENTVLSFPKFGGMRPSWNRLEWSHSKRMNNG